MYVLSNADPSVSNDAAAVASPQFDFIPETLRLQCRSLVQTYHAMHGYACLPDILWKAGLGAFIEKHHKLRDALRRASTTRSARTANTLFVAIATEVLSLEVLARDYANWSAVLPAAKRAATEMLEQGTPASRTWLMAHYLYPPRYDSPVASLALPPSPFAPADDHLSDVKSFRDIVLACRAEDLARQSRRGTSLAMQESPDR